MLHTLGFYRRVARIKLAATIATVNTVATISQILDQSSLLGTAQEQRHTFCWKYWERSEGGSTRRRGAGH